MPNAAELVRLQLSLAFDGRPDMSLMGALAGVTDQEAVWTPPGSAADSPTDSQASSASGSVESLFPTIEEIVRHVAWSKCRFCQQAFGTSMPLDDPTVNADGDADGVPWEMPCGCAWGRDARPGMAGAVELLRSAQAILVQCLSVFDSAGLSQPIDCRHGSSAANFFVTMAIHDVYHAGQIRTRRTLAALSTHRA